MLPAIDAHAHVEVYVGPEDLVELDALVLAVTTQAEEWAPAGGREDEMTIWGIGVHPLRRTELESFSITRFEEAVSGCLLVGEIGLDRKTLSDRSTMVFEEILSVLAQVSRPATIHSSGAERSVLDALARKPVQAPILHWWRGGVAETRAAIDLGCYFSLNGAQAESNRLLELIPPDRVFTETDYPHSRKRDPHASRPGAVETIEDRLMSEWGADRFAVRRRLWRNVAALFDRCELLERLPLTTQESILAAGLD